MRHQLVTLLLAPLLYLQGRATRRDTVVLPEPPGDRSGRVGEGRPLRLLVTGDSAAAGVGASHQDNALLGSLKTALAGNFELRWELHAKSGATSDSTLRKLRRIERRTFDVAITSLGVNDVTAGTSRRRWRHQQRQLRSLLRERFGTGLIIVSGLPPVSRFPALPQPLRWYLGQRAEELDRDLARDVADEPGSVFLGFESSIDADMMAPDGFHPGPAIYSEWGRRAADIILSRMPPASPGIPSTEP